LHAGPIIAYFACEAKGHGMPDGMQADFLTPLFESPRIET